MTAPQNNNYYKEKIPSGYKAGKVQNFTPEAIQLLQSLYQHVGPESQTAKLAGGDEETFRQIEAPAMKQFQGFQGQMASRFSGMGMGGARNSSGFQNTANQASSDFAMQLQSQRQQLMSQAIKDLMGMSHSLMNEQPYETNLIKKDQSSSGWGGLTGAAVGGLGGFFAGGPAGALTGANMGYNIGSKF
jgi:hypothetical protein